MSWDNVKQRNPQRRYVTSKLRHALDELTKNDVKGLSRIDKVYHKVDDCMALVNLYQCQDCGMLHFDSALYCKNKLCPICAYLRARKYMSVLVPRFNRMLKSGFKINFLTLTIKDTKTLSEGLNILKKAWRYMTHQDIFSKHVFNSMFIGGIYAIEIKKGKYSGLWHPHIHLLVVKDHFSKDFDLIKGLWEMACQKVVNTNEKIGSVDIRGVKNKNNRYTNNIDDLESITSAVVECVKYVTKFSFDNFSSFDLLELCNNLYNSRLFSTFGCMRESEDEDIDKDYKEVVKKLVCSNCGSLEFDSVTSTIDKCMNVEVRDFDKQYLSDKEVVDGLTALMEVLLKKEYEQ